MNTREHYAAATEEYLRRLRYDFACNNQDIMLYCE